MRYFLCLILIYMPVFQASANGCIVVRPTSQLSIGLSDVHIQEDTGRFEFTTSYRYLTSDRHFRGREEEAHRQEEGSDVRNTTHTIDFSLNYWMNEEWRFSASIPYVDSRRSSLYEHDRVNRHTMRASGIGDLRLMGYREMLFETDDTVQRGLTFGFGVKLPTGEKDAKDIAYRPDGPELRNVDQSIQPGDGGVGAIVELQAFTSVVDDRTFAFLNASYLINPRDTNGVSTHRSRETEAIMSVPDTYQARLGLTRVVNEKRSLSVDASLRVEGVPADDLIGDSNGFRRPGYAIYFEPAVNYQRGPHRFNLSVPVAVERNRTRSKSDRITGRHGDAAFADYLVMSSYSFGWQ